MTMQTQEQRDALRKNLLAMGFVCTTPTYNDFREHWVRDGAVMTLRWTYPLEGDPEPQRQSFAPMRYFLLKEDSYYYEITEDSAKGLESNGLAHVSRGGSGVVPEEVRQPGETRDQYMCPWLVMEPGPTPPVGRG